jgi:hypothetical protein
MPSSAAQLPRQRGGTCRHRGAVIGCRAPQTLQPERGLSRLAGAAVVVVVEDVRTPATPFVALSAVRTSVHLVARTSSVQATGVNATGVIRVSGQTGVRRGVRCPRCPDRAGSRTSVPRDRPRLADRVRRVAVVSEAAWSSLPESGLAGKGWSNVGRARLARGSTAHLDRRFAGAPAGATRSPPGRPRELVRR